MKTRILRRASRLACVVIVVIVIAMSTAAMAKPPSASKADLAISMTDSPDPARTGSMVTFSILVSNAGPSQATRVQATDSYPPEAAVMSVKSSRGSCDIDQQIVCSVGNLDSGETVEVVVELKSYTAGTLVNSAAVSGDQNDPARSNNSASTSTEIYDCSSCPTITISDTPDPAVAGEIIVYDIQGSAPYNSSAVLRGTQLVMRLPEGTEFLGATAFSCCAWIALSCTYADRTVSCGGGTNPKATIAIRPLNAGQLTVEAGFFVKGFANPMASASAVTTVGPPRAPGTATPTSVRDQAEDQSEALLAKVEKTRESIPTSGELKDEADYLVESTRQEAQRVICRLTCFR
jgi:uncharacterized repeat protein (TIGR01451 family)